MTSLLSLLLIDVIQLMTDIRKDRRSASYSVACRPFFCVIVFSPYCCVPCTLLPVSCFVNSFSKMRSSPIISRKDAPDKRALSLG